MPHDQEGMGLEVPRNEFPQKRAMKVLRAVRQSGFGVVERNTSRATVLISAAA